MTHRCYACAPGNPDRVFTYEGDRGAAHVPARFSGPPGSANGGIAVGALACPARRALGLAGAAGLTITARLSAPIVLEREHSVELAGLDAVGASVALVHGDATVIAATVRKDDAPVEGDPALALLGELARVQVPDRPPFFEETGDHPIPGCFSCGPRHPDGLHIYPRVAADGVTCAPWRPAAAFDDGDGSISPMIVASALDCSSGICMPVQLQRDLLDEDRFFLLGSLEVRYLRPAPVARDYRVAAQARRRDGRKFFGVSALFDAGGTPYAFAQATWIVAGITRSEAFGSR